MNVLNNQYNEIYFFMIVKNYYGIHSGPLLVCDKGIFEKSLLVISPAFHL